LTQVAQQHKEKGVSSTFVVAATDLSAEVAGFYALSIAQTTTALNPLLHGWPAVPATAGAKATKAGQTT